MKTSKSVFEDNKKIFREKNKIEVLTEYEEFINNSRPLECRCLVCGKSTTPTYASLKSGRGCKFCAAKLKGRRKMMSETEFNGWKEKFSNQQAVRINIEYGDFRGTNRSISAICLECGKEFRPTFWWLMKGSGCKACSMKRSGEKRRDSEQQFSEKKDKIRETSNIEVMSEYSKYKNAHTKLECLCLVCGSSFESKMTNLLSGKGCRSCVIIKSRVGQEEFEEFKTKSADVVEILTDYSQYTRSDKYLECKCATCGREFKKTFAALKKGHFCAVCGHNSGGVKLRVPEEEFYSRVEQFYSKKKILVLTKYDQYRRSGDRLECICEVCNSKIFPSFGTLTRGGGCAVCASSRYSSAAEEEILQFIEGAIPGVICKKNDREVLGGKEIDVFLPEHNIGVEHHGLYWHSFAAGGDKKKHREKYELATKAGIRLFQIFEDEWINKREIVKSMVLNAIGLTSQKIYARNCRLVELDKQNKKSFEEFFDNNHIAGNVRFDWALGLESDGELVCAISTRKPFIKKYGDVVELARSCSRVNTLVVGGFSRLLKHLCQQDISGVLSYADLRFGSGAVYAQNGFEYMGRTAPDYFYTDFSERFNRFKYRAQPGKTEVEVAKENGVSKIYGVGSEIFLLQTKDAEK